MKKYPDVDPLELRNSFSYSVRQAFFEQLHMVKTKYENAKNEELHALNDGKKHNKFSCRDNATEMTMFNCLRFMMCMRSGDIYTEFVDSGLFDMNHLPDESSYCQMRDKIPLDYFYDLFRWTVETYYWPIFHPAGVLSLTIIACDGTEHAYAANLSELNNYVKTRSDYFARNVIHLNCCVDTDRHYLIDAIPQDAHDKDERQAYYIMMERIVKRFPNLDQRRNLVFTTDRGYEAWYLPVLADFLDTSFLCRIKAEDSNGVLSGIRDLLPDSRNSFDWNITVTLTRDTSKKGNNKYHVLSPNTFCPLVTRGHDYTITLRITKLHISDNVYEYLFSNLSKTMYSKEAMKVLYHRRWPCEDAYGLLKYPLCLNDPHAISRVPVMKEMWCRLTMFNICSTIVSYNRSIEKKEDTGRKYDYTLEFSSAIASVRRYMRTDEDKLFDLDAAVKQRTRPIRDDVKSTPRQKTPRKRPKTGHRS